MEPGIAQSLFRWEFSTSRHPPKFGLDVFDPLLAFQDLGLLSFDPPLDLLHFFPNAADRGFAGNRQIRGRVNILGSSGQSTVPNGGLTSQSFDLGLGNLKCSVRLRCSRCGGQGITERVQVCFREGFQLSFPSSNLPLEFFFFGDAFFLTLQSLFQRLRGLRARQSGRTAQAKRFDGLQFTFQFQILHAGPQRRLDSRQLRLPFGQGLLSVAIASQVLV